MHARMLTHSVMSDSWQPHGLQPATLLCPWNFPGKNARVHCHFLLLCLLYWQADSLPLSYMETPSKNESQTIQIFSKFNLSWNWLQLSVHFSHSVVSDSLQPHGLHHTRLPCPSPTPKAYSRSCPLSQWCHPTISSSIVPFSSCLQSDWIFLWSIQSPTSHPQPQSCLFDLVKIWDRKKLGCSSTYFWFVLPLDSIPAVSHNSGTLKICRTIHFFRFFNPSCTPLYGKIQSR